MADVKIGVHQEALNASKGAVFSGAEAIYAPNAVLTGLPLTMVAWVTVGTANNCVLAVNDDSGDDLFHGILINTTAVAAYSRQTAFVNSSINHGKSFGNLVHVAAVFASDSSRIIYADGVAGPEDTSSQPVTGINTFSIGAQAKTLGQLNREYTGTIYHAAFYNRALSPAEIAELAAGANPQDYAGLVRYLPLNGAANAASEIIEPSTWTVAGTLADGAGDTTVTKQTFTNANLDGKTPKAALAFLTNATVADTVTANAHLSLGATDGVNEWALAHQSENGTVSSSNVHRESFYDATIASLDNGDPAAVNCKASYSAFSADSTALNFTDAAPSAFLASMIQFAGDDLRVEVGKLFVPISTAVDSAVTATLADSSLEADIIIFGYFREDIPFSNPNLFSSIGFATNESGGIGNYCVSRTDRDGQATSSLSAVVRNNRCASSYQLGATENDNYEVTAITAGSFDVTLRDQAYGQDRDLVYLALSFGGAQVKAGTIETPTDDTVDWNVTGVGFEPQFVFSAFSGIALSSGYNTVSTAEVAGPLSLWAFDGSNEAGVAISSRDNATTTETLSITREGLQSRIIVGFESDLVKLNSPTMNSDGWSVAAADIDTANTFARQGIYFAVENAGATIAPITGSTSIAFSSAATAAAINQIAASASVNFTGTAALLNITPVASTTSAESEADRLAFFDLDEFGSLATINSSQVAGILEQPNVQIDVGEGPVMSAAAPIFYCRSSDISGVLIGQAVTIVSDFGSYAFQVVEIRPDGDGITALVLHDA